MRPEIELCHRDLQEQDMALHPLPRDPASSPATKSRGFLRHGKGFGYLSAKNQDTLSSTEVKDSRALKDTGLLSFLPKHYLSPSCSLLPGSGAESGIKNGPRDQNQSGIPTNGSSLTNSLFFWSFVTVFLLLAICHPNDFILTVMNDDFALVARHMESLFNPK